MSPPEQCPKGRQAAREPGPRLYTRWLREKRHAVFEERESESKEMLAPMDPQAPSDVQAPIENALGGRSAVSRRASGRQRPLFGFLVLVVVLLGVVVGFAQAGKGVEGFFGSQGSGDGQFETPRGVAVNESGVGGVGAGDVYVVDEGNGRVQRFDADGTYVTQFGSPGTGAGELSEPRGIAVDQGTGDVYVSEAGGLRVSKFDAAGSFLSMFGRDVDSDGGTDAEVCTTAGTCQAGTAGSAGGELGSAGSFPGHLSVVPVGAANAGNVLVADSGNRRVQEFTPAGVFVRAFGWDVDGPDGDDEFEICTVATSCLAGDGGENAGQFAANSPTRVVADSTGAIYTVEPSRVQKFEPQAGPPNLNPLGAFAPADLTGSELLPVTNVEIGSADRVLVARNVGAGFTSCPDGGTSPAGSPILELDSTGVLEDTHITCAGIASVNGLGVNATSGLMYVATVDSDHRVYTLDNIASPEAVALAPSDVGTRSATFEGTVNPNGTTSSDETRVRIEYRPVGAASFIALPWEDIGTANVPVAVSFEKLGLQPNKDYEYRLRAAKAFGNSGAISAPATFTTNGEPPTVEIAATTVSEDHAVLRSRVNANNQPTAYHFEYGPAASYGTRAPVADASAGSGGSPAIAAQGIDGLQADTTYHYRVVATNASGTTTGPDRVLTTAPRGGRNYELVSDVDKEGSDVTTDGGRIRAIGDDMLLFHSLRAFGDAQGTGISTEYLAVRDDEEGWAPHAVTPLHGPQPIVDALGTFDPHYVGELDDDTPTGVYISRTPLTDDAPTGVKNLYVRRDLNTPGGGTWELLTDATGSVSAPAGYRPVFAGASSDFSHIAFTSALNLTADAPTQSVQCQLGLFGSCQPRAYEHTDTGVRFLGRIPALPATECTAAACVSAVRSIVGQAPTLTSYAFGAISDDGERVYFTVGNNAGASTGALYLREGDTTIRVNATQNPSSITSPARFETASSDGSKAFFTTAERLIPTDTDGFTDLYRFDRDAPAGARLTRLSIDEEPLDDGTNAPVVKAVYGISDDGETVYFSAGSQLVNGAQLAEIGESMLFVWHQGEVRFVGAGPENLNESVNWALQRRWSRVTPDGKHVLFVSRSPNQPTGDASATCGVLPCNRAYVYSLDGNGGAGALACASCRRDGGASQTNVNYIPRIGVGAAVSEAHLNHALSDDGRFVFFSSGDALVPEDHNGAYDVYAYDVSNGSVMLLSKGEGDSFFVEASPSGNNVYFTTRAQLVGSDVDDNRDMYDARLGGGFPEPPVPPVQCGTGDACKGVGSPVPGAVAPGSRSFFGLGSPSFDFPLPFFRVGSLGGRLRERLAAGLAADVSVRVSGAGRVSARLRARLDGRLRLVDAASKRVARGGIVRLRVELPQAALARLRGEGRLRLALAVRYGPVRRAQHRSLTLRLSRGDG